jgi:hypothetical protein
MDGLPLRQLMEVEFSIGLLGQQLCPSSLKLCWSVWFSPEEVV